MSLVFARPLQVSLVSAALVAEVSRGLGRILKLILELVCGNPLFLDVAISFESRDSKDCEARRLKEQNW